MSIPDHVDASRNPQEAPVGILAARFYQDRRLIVLSILLVIAAGVSSLLILPRMEDPMLSARAANVLTALPGADAERVEALVTEKIEERLLDVPEIKRIRSQSRAGLSFVTIELRDEIYDTDAIWAEIRGKINDSIGDLPAEASRPLFDELEIAAYAWIGAVVWESESAPVEGIMRRLARELKDRLLTLPGTKLVDLYGDPGEEILVELDPERLAGAGLSAESVAAQLAQADVKNSVGMLRNETTELVVDLGNEFRSLQEIRQSTVQTNEPGQSLQLRDLATVRRATPTPPESKAIVDGKLGVVVSVMLRPEYRIDQWSLGAREIVREFQSELPPDMGLQVVMEQSEYVDSRMQTLARNLLLGVLAVAIMTFVFMGWRSAILVTATLPIASLMVVAGMRFLEIPIHQMSVTGLIIALGLMIDNAIIATDEIQLNLKRGFSPIAAVRDLVSRLFAPLLASTVTTALAFAPIALMEGPAGEFVGAIAITVMLAILSSFLLAMTVLPAMAAWIQAPVYQSEGKRGTARGVLRRQLEDGISIQWVTNRYRSFLTLMLKRPMIGIAIGCGLPLAGFIASTQLDEQFFPPADRNQFHIEIELSPQSSLARTEEIVREIDKFLDSEPRVQHTSWFLGESAPPFYYNVIARRKNSPNYGQAIITLDSNRNSLGMIRRLQLALDDRFPECRILVRQLEQGPPFDAPVELRLLGPDLETLVAKGTEMRRIASTIPDVLHTRTMLGESRPAAIVDVDTQQIQWAGLSEEAVGRQLFASIEGEFVGSIIEQVEEVPVRVRLKDLRHDDFGDLEQMQLLVSASAASASTEKSERLGMAINRFAPLGELATVSYGHQRSVITRYNGIRSNEVSKLHYSWNTAVSRVEAISREVAKRRF